MPRVTHVAKARERFERIPVTDNNGATVQSEVARTTKTGRAVTRRQSKPDHSKPLPPLVCDHCRKPIEVGTSYKWIAPKIGGRKNRHESCPGWHPWEYSSALWARLAEIEHNAITAFSTSIIEDPSDVESIMQDAAEEARAIAEEKREAAENIREGFQHDTYLSEELDEQADSIESWADDLESFDVPELPEPEEEDCEECEGSGNLGEENCDTCGGSGQITPDEPTDDQMDEWRNEVESAMSDALQAPI